MIDVRVLIIQKGESSESSAFFMGIWATLNPSFLNQPPKTIGEKQPQTSPPNLSPTPQRSLEHKPQITHLGNLKRHVPQLQPPVTGPLYLLSWTKINREIVTVPWPIVFLTLIQR